MLISGYPEQLQQDFAPVIAITGTHSSGKSTLMQSLHEGLVSHLLDVGDEEDLGYGVVSNEQNDIPLILVPEAARRVAVDLWQDPEMLTEGYSLATQYEIDAQHVIRAGIASALAREVATMIETRGIAGIDRPMLSPVVITDRGPLDGLVYSGLRAGLSAGDTVEELSRNRLLTGFTQASVNAVIVCDPHDVPFEYDGARLEDVDFRLAVHREIVVAYEACLGIGPIVLRGNNQDRLVIVKQTIADVASASASLVDR